MFDELYDWIEINKYSVRSSVVRTSLSFVTNTKYRWIKYTADSIRIFDSKTNRTADLIRHSIRTKKTIRRSLVSSLSTNQPTPKTELDKRYKINVSFSKCLLLFFHPAFFLGAVLCNVCRWLFRHVTTFVTAGRLFGSMNKKLHMRIVAISGLDMTTSKVLHTRCEVFLIFSLTVDLS